MKKMDHANELLKDIIESSDSTYSTAFKEMWDKKVDDKFTFGDVMTNALEYSINVPNGFFVIIDGELFKLIVNKRFNMKVVERIVGKTVIVRTKPKNVSKLDYLAAPGIKMKVLKTKTNRDQLVLKPDIKIRKIFIADGYDDPDNLIMTVDDLKGIDIVEIIYNTNEEYPCTAVL